MHTVPMSYVQAANRDAGGHFFDEDNMRFSDSRIECEGAFFNAQSQQAFFVTSECLYLGAPRSFKVRRYDDDTGRIVTVSKVGIATKSEALELAKSMASSLH